MSNLRIAVRTQMKSVIETALASIPGVLVSYRPTRQPVKLPAVTFRDTGRKIGQIVPLWDRTYYIDIWARTGLDDAELMADLIAGVLDVQPFVLTGDEGRVDSLIQEADEDIPTFDADLTRKMLTYRMRVYDYTAPQPFGETFQDPYTDLSPY